MYSNNIYAFFIILCFAPLISAGVSQLRPEDYYNKSCPGLQDKVSLGVSKASMYDPRIHNSLLRMHFHDCFVNGCDASLLLDDTPTVQGEQSSVLNRNISPRGFQVIDDIKTDVEILCPRTVSCADIMTLVARASIKLALHKNVTTEPWKIGLGRQDGLVPNKTGADNELPSRRDSVNTLIAKFATKGLNTQDLVVLSGAYIIGFPISNNSNNILAPLDWNSNNKTAQMAKFYNANPASFLKDFEKSMVKMSTVDVITAGGVRQGEIRWNCGSKNSN